MSTVRVSSAPLIRFSSRDVIILPTMSMGELQCALIRVCYSHVRTYVHRALALQFNFDLPGSFFVCPTLKSSSLKAHSWLGTAQVEKGVRVCSSI